MFVNPSPTFQIEMTRGSCLNCYKRRCPGSDRYDTNLIPVKGHLVIFSPQDEMDFMVSSWHQKRATFFSLIPWKTQLVLGGTMEEGVEDLSADEEKVNCLIENAHNFFNLR